MLDAARVRPRGLFFFSNHPWIGVVILVLVVALVVYLNRKRH